MLATDVACSFDPRLRPWVRSEDVDTISLTRGELVLSSDSMTAFTVLGNSRCVEVGFWRFCLDDFLAGLEPRQILLCRVKDEMTVNL